MSLVKSKITLSLLLAVLSLATLGCSVDRSGPRVVSEAAFRAILAKDYRQLRQLAGPRASIPSPQVWNDASFIRDYTSDERIKERWMKGSIGGYALNEVVMEDFQGFFVHLERLVQVRFVLSGKSYLATFPITLGDDKWSPGLNPSLGDFFVRFEERVE